MKNCIILLSLLVIYSFPYAAKANEAISHDVINVAVTHLPPYRIVNGDHVEGIFIEILEAIFHPINLKLKYTIAPFKRCLHELKYGNVDMYIGLFKRPEREEFVYFIEPPFQNKTVKSFYLRKGEGDRIKRYEDLYNLKLGVGVRLKFKTFPRFDEDNKIIKQEVRTDEMNLKKLEAGHIDAFVQTEEVAEYLITTLGFTGKFEKSVYTYDKPNPAYIAVSKKSLFMNRIEEIETAVKQFVKSGNVDKIKQRYFKKLKDNN